MWMRRRELMLGFTWDWKDKQKPLPDMSKSLVSPSMSLPVSHIITQFFNFNFLSRQLNYSLFFLAPHYALLGCSIIIHVSNSIIILSLESIKRTLHLLLLFTIAKFRENPSWIYEMKWEENRNLRATLKSKTNESNNLSLQLQVGLRFAHLPPLNACFSSLCDLIDSNISLPIIQKLYLVCFWCPSGHCFHNSPISYMLDSFEILVSCCCLL